MENSNQTTNIQEETVMSNIQKIFNDYVEAGGDIKVTAFKRHLDQLINNEIKPLCGRSGKAADGNDWRSVLKARFSGRGAKWVQVPTDSVIPTLDRLDAEGFTTDAYRTHIENAGYAFIRFAGPRLAFDNIQAAAFEVRTNGSTFDHPKQLHYIAVDQIDSLVKPLGGTPHSLKLEVIAKPQEAEEVKEIEVEISEADAAPVVEEDCEDMMGDIESLMALENETL